MLDAVIVSTAHTPIGKAYCGALNDTDGATLLGEAIKAAVTRAQVADLAGIKTIVERLEFCVESLNELALKQTALLARLAGEGASLASL
jgi:acetyl-CoA acetyltransferase